VLAAYITGAPRVFDNKVIIRFGSDTGVNRGYITAYDARDGRNLSRFFIVPGNPATRPTASRIRR
jgi:quinohemoprotein ethanol dehydrogenase